MTEHAVRRRNGRVIGCGLALVAVVATGGCADVGDSTLPAPSAAAPSPVSSGPTVPATEVTRSVRCEPAPDDLAFSITLNLEPPGSKLRRPFVVERDGKVYFAADTLTAKGELREPGVLWIARDRAGKGLSSLSDSARTESTLPDGRAAFRASPTDPAALQAQDCVRTG